MSLTVAEFERLEEHDVRIWFMKTELEQAEDTFRVVQGIIETRKQFQPKRKRRSDAGVKRDAPALDFDGTKPK